MHNHKRANNAPHASVCVSLFAVYLCVCGCACVCLYVCMLHVVCSVFAVLCALPRINKQRKFANIMHMKFTKWLQRQGPHVCVCICVWVGGWVENFWARQQVYTTKWRHPYRRTQPHRSAVQTATKNVKNIYIESNKVLFR